MMNAVCTIVAKNYLSQALTLGDSLKKIHPDLPFHILLADETENLIDLSKEKYNIIEFKDIGVPFYKDMAFKYNVIEFCTATKPFFIDYLFKIYNYEKIIYFDPDIYVYNKLDSIFNQLDFNFVILTPHFVMPENEYSGGFSDEECLVVGICNLGFIAIKNCEKGRTVIDWWKSKLKDKCYSDKMTGLFVDQKWMNYLPALFDNVLISRELGYNVAVWNLHERNVALINKEYYIIDRHDESQKSSLVFFHFSGFNPNHPEIIHSRQNRYHLSDFPELKILFVNYAKELLSNCFNEYKQLPYKYEKFDNGLIIIRLYQRIYRTLTQERDFNFEEPFSTKNGTFYTILKINNLIIKDKGGTYNRNNNKYSFPDLENKIKILDCVMRFIKSFLGIRLYSYLIRYFNNYCIEERQTFLIKKLPKKIQIK
jgi:hypothetical protein